MATIAQTITIPPPQPNQYPRIIAGFWRRVFGAVIDAAVLAIVGKALGLVYFDWLLSLRSWALLVGAGIAALYYIPLTSNIGGGRTLGKRFVGTRVVGHDGQPVGLGRSAIRFVVFAILLFANDIPAVSTRLDAILNVVGTCLVWSTLYLLIFNRQARQTMHDLAAGTFVVEDVWSEGPVRQRTWKGHAIVAGLLIVLVGALGFIIRPLVTRLAWKQESVRTQASVLQALRTEPEIADASFETPRGHLRPDEPLRNELTLKVRLHDKPASFDQEADKVARILLSKTPAGSKVEEITISVGYGFDMGIAKSEKSQQTALPPKEWQQRLSR